MTFQGKSHSEEYKKHMSEMMKGKFKGKILSEEHKQKISLSSKGRTAWNKNITGYKRKPHSEETKKLIGLANSGINWTDERRKIVSESMKNNKNMLGKHHTKEAKRKMRLSRIGKSSWIKGKYQTEETKQKIRQKRAIQIFSQQDTSIEVKIQNFLKALQIDFFTHQYMNQIEHAYQCDILIPSMKMVIECDGDYWHKYPVGLDKDHVRTQELVGNGFKVLRLWEHEINSMESPKELFERIEEIRR